MKTEFRPEQLSRPEIARSEKILRACVHCGMCTATCPSYQILGNELDSPRGRIYLIKSLLEEGRKPDLELVEHIDQCLSCLACTTTCPSGVDYMHLIDDMRVLIEENYQRPLVERWLRSFVAGVLPYPNRFRVALSFARWFRPIRFLFSGRLRALLELTPNALPKRRNENPPVISKGNPKRVAILSGCAESVLDPEIHARTISLLARLGVEVVEMKDNGCCGALVHHMGRKSEAEGFALSQIQAWLSLGELDAIIIHTSGCGTMIKDYGYIFRDTAFADSAKRVSELAKDITEFLMDIFPYLENAMPVKVGYHAACSLQHGQKVKDEPLMLLKRAGFQVTTPFESHLCCGSAGTYSIFQPKIAEELGMRKVQNLEKLDIDVVAAGNIGCITQIAQYSNFPIVHTAALLDWALGGSKPY